MMNLAILIGGPFDGLYGSLDSLWCGSVQEIVMMSGDRQHVYTLIIGQRGGAFRYQYEGVRVEGNGAAKHGA